MAIFDPVTSGLQLGTGVYLCISIYTYTHKTRLTLAHTYPHTHNRDGVFNSTTHHPPPTHIP